MAAEIDNAKNTRNLPLDMYLPILPSLQLSTINKFELNDVNISPMDKSIKIPINEISFFNIGITMKTNIVRN